MKAILIARVSTEEQKEAGNSLPAQIARLEAYCRNKGFPIMETWSFDESAYSNDRTEFDRIIDLILKQQETIAICCDKVDRITRNIFDTRISTLYEKALNGKLELHFVSDGQVINSKISAVEKFQFSINLGLAKYYSDAISDNVKRAQEQKLRKGEWLAKAPFGYKNIKKDDGTTDIIVEEYEAQIIKKTFELYATGAFSIDLLLKKLKSEHGVPWPRGSLGKLLNNPFYHGIMIVKGKKYPHRYPPLISLALFDKVQEVKSKFNKKSFKFAGLPYMYRGLIRCGHCDLSITPEKHKGYIYYHCTQYKGKHNAKWLREEAITKQLGSVFKKMTIPEEIVEEIVKNLNTLQQDKVDFYKLDMDKFTKEQKSLSKMLDNLYLDKLKGSITESEYDKFYQSLHDQLICINSRIEQLEESDDNYFTTAKYVLSLANKAHELFENSEVEEKRQLINLLLSNVRVEDEYVLYDVQKPFDMIINCSDSQLWRG